MRIAINTRFLLKHKMEGFGWFTYEIVKRIVEAHPEHDFIFFFDRSFDKKFIFADNVKPVVLYPQARHPVLFKIWFDYSITKALKKYKADLFFSPDGYLSLKTEVPQIGVIHDLNFEHHPEDLPKSALRYLRKYFPKFANKAKKIITVSEYSKQDICSTYNIDSNKVVVAHNGASDKFTPLPQIEQINIRKKYTDGKPYFVYVGALHARKNIERMLHGFFKFKEQTGSETKLLIVGESLWKNANYELILKQSNYSDAVLFSGHVKLAELTQIVGAAKALTLVSYFEGFGIPLVEAMRANVPILTSNKTSLPEVAGNAGLCVDPYSIEAITNGMQALDSDDNLRKELIEKGQEQQKKFSWDNSAKIIWEEIVNVGTN